MPITADLGGKSYTLGKGKVFFDRYPNGVTIGATTLGEGERYFGNTPEFTTSASSESLDHFSSEGGLKTKDDSVQLSLDRTGKMVCDNISADNIALFFLGTSSTVAQTLQSGLSTIHTDAKRGRFYQAGVSANNPAGLRNITSVVVKKETTPDSGTYDVTITLAGNYQVDADLGRIYIEAAAPDIADGTNIKIEFGTAASTRNQVVSGSDPIYGALRFVSDNPKGENRDYYFPYVKLAPDGDYALKGEEWMQIGFTFEILKKADNIQGAYIDGRPTLV
jgi:hypothetical protein